MKIDWEIDLSAEDGDKDGDNCLGSIFLEDGDGNEVSENLTYIDSWLFELGESAIRLENDRGNFRVDLLIEPENLIICQMPKGFSLSYKNNSLHIKSVAEYKTCIVEAIQRFIDVCRGSGEYSSLLVEELEGVLLRIRG